MKFCLKFIIVFILCYANLFYAQLRESDSVGFEQKLRKIDQSTNLVEKNIQKKIHSPDL
jgi:hypothetical protein